MDSEANSALAATTQGWLRSVGKTLRTCRSEIALAVMRRPWEVADSFNIKRLWTLSLCAARITMQRLIPTGNVLLSGMSCIALWAFVGCGTTREYNATQQLVMSDAVDRSIANLDFRPLSGRKVYLDTSYLRHVKGQGFVNSEYVTSALRQQIVAAGCYIQDAASEAEIVIEARIGTLGIDDHRVTYGVPENNGLSSTVSLIPGAPVLPNIPEIAIARREAREAAAKIACFAYDRTTRAPIWQSGVDNAVATARDTWVMGVGPFQAGTIREQTKLAGSRIRFGEKSATGSPARFFDRPPVDYTAETRFQSGWPVFKDGGFGPDMIGVPEEEIAEAKEADGLVDAPVETELAEKDDQSTTVKR